MSRIQDLEQKVHQLYDAKDPARDEWCDWLAAHHVFVVADNASALAQRFGANADLARAAALLHDCADAKTSRFDAHHEQMSLDIAREILQQTGFAKDEVALIVDDAIRYHSCHGDEAPSSLEGNVLSTADSLAHLKTDFYVYFVWAKGGKTPLEKVKNIVLEKIERDFHKKIRFDDVRAECRDDYERLKTLFIRPPAAYSEDTNHPD